jgi:hypothetical protein
MSVEPALFPLRHEVRVLSPLSDGTLDADCVTCHLARVQFRSRHRRSDQGPRIDPAAPVYEKRVTADKLELRPREKRALPQRGV